MCAGNISVGVYSESLIIFFLSLRMNMFLLSCLYRWHSVGLVLFELCVFRICLGMLIVLLFSL